jgi:hypothetical protein
MLYKRIDGRKENKVEDPQCTQYIRVEKENKVEDPQCTQYIRVELLKI